MNGSWKYQSGLICYSNLVFLMVSVVRKPIGSCKNWYKFQSLDLSKIQVSTSISYPSHFTTLTNEIKLSSWNSGNYHVLKGAFYTTQTFYRLVVTYHPKMYWEHIFISFWAKIRPRCKIPRSNTSLCSWKLSRYPQSESGFNLKVCSHLPWSLLHMYCNWWLVVEIWQPCIADDVDSRAVEQGCQLMSDKNY